MTVPALVVGGGPVGAVFALAWQRSGRQVTVLEQQPVLGEVRDERFLALSYGSRLILESLGVWSQLAAQAQPIQSVCASQRGHFGQARFLAEDEGLDALGYVVPYFVLCRVLGDIMASSPRIQLLCGAQVTAVTAQNRQVEIVCTQADQAHVFMTPLLVLAHGEFRGALPSPAGYRVHDYQQMALLTRVRCSRDTRGVAHERFSEAGIFALLPCGMQEYALVMTLEAGAVQDWTAMPDEVFLQTLHQQFGDYVGDFVSVTPRVSFPLRLQLSEPHVSPHVVAIGNAAHTLHPVAAQGLNLGLRDAWELAQAVMVGCDVNSVLAHYARTRCSDVLGSVLLTDMLVRTQRVNHVLGAGRWLGLGLAALELHRPVKKMLARRLNFGSR